MDDDICYLSVRRLNQLFERKTLSPVELIKTVLGRIERYNPTINAFCIVDQEKALSAARRSEERWLRGESLGMFDGIPVSVKDLSLTAGWPTRRGSQAIPAEGAWNEDAPSVARMREEGAVLFGKTTVPEFGTGVGHSELCGITRNPWNPRKTTGGSSSGAAASLAAGMGTIALASDAGGSIRTPCSFTGVAGLKPTFGLVPDYPSSYLGSVAVIGPMARSVEDCALAMNVICRPDVRDPYALPYTRADFTQALTNTVNGTRIAFSPTLGYANVDPEIASIVEDAVRVFRDHGAKVEVIEQVFPDPSATVSVVMAAGLANAFNQFAFTEEQLKLVNPRLMDIVRFGRQLTATQYLAAQRERERLGIAMQELHRKYALLITPTMPISAFDAGLECPPEPQYMRPSDWKPFGSAFNLTLQPAASIPCGFTRRGLPVGMQIVGPRHNDAEVLQACRAFEAIQPFCMPDMAACGEFSKKTEMA